MNSIIDSTPLKMRALALGLVVCMIILPSRTCLGLVPISSACNGKHVTSAPYCYHRRQLFSLRRSEWRSSKDHDGSSRLLTSTTGTDVTEPTTSRPEAEVIDQSKRWEDKYNALVKYKKQNGHTNVPWSQRSIGRWVGYQRRNYKESLQQKKLSSSNSRITMAQHRIDKLEAIGFQWDMRAAQWEEKYVELEEYHKVNGHCNVPQMRRDSLSVWVATQRMEFKAYKEGETRCTNAVISEETFERRIELLEKLGFQYNLINGWETSYQKLLQYNAKHGHCNVNTISGGQLGGWVNIQRCRYNKFNKARRGGKEDGKQSIPSSSSLYPLSDDQIKRLEDIGFQWQLHDSPGWDTRYQELEAYKEKHGDCLVPDGSGELGKWVGRQRHLYKNLRDYRAGEVLLQERIDRLNEIEFTWEVKPWPDWETMYSTLQAYHEKNGHCHLAKSRKRLFLWSNQQRHQYARYQQDLPSLMDKKRELKLNRLDFEWDSDLAEWKAMREKVKVHVDEHGLDSLDVRGDLVQIKSRDNTKLFEWVMIQRGFYEKNKLSSEQGASLDDIGFSWMATL